MSKPMIRQCIRCGKATRPANKKVADAPGTVVRSSGDLCGTCYGRDYKAGLVKPRAIVRQGIKAECARCGITRVAGTNTSPLCRDCKSVLSAEEKEMWAA